MSRAAGRGRFWLRQFLNDTFLRACAVFTVVCALMPPEGLGVELCPCQRLVHAPCPGCGMTRCGSCLVRGHVHEALRYHPLGAVLIPAGAALGLLGVAPRRWRSRVRTHVVLWGASLRPLYLLTLLGFVAFGVVR